MSTPSFVTRVVLCSLTAALTAVAQCPPPGGYQRPTGGPGAPGGWGPQAGAPAGPQPAGPTTPRPADPGVPVPNEGRPVTPRPPAGPAAAVPGRTGPRGLQLSFERGHTAKERLKVEWLHPVPPAREGEATAAAGPLALEIALEQLWADGDERPLLVLRECSLCKDGDEALLARSLNNDKTLLLSKWFRAVRLPPHVTETGHPFHNVFAAHGFADGWPHFFLLAHPGAKPVAFTGQQTQSQLWKGMLEVLGQRYAKDPQKALKEWLAVLDAFDTIDGRQRQLQEQLDELRATEGPDSARAKKAAADLAKLKAERDELVAREQRAKDLGLLSMPRKVAAK